MTDHRSTAGASTGATLGPLRGPDARRGPMAAHLFALSLIACVAALSAPRPAAAQGLYPFADTQGQTKGSPEHFGLELRVGMYRPDLGSKTDAFKQIFGSDNGPFVGGELDLFPVRIPYVGLLGAGLGIGWAKYTATNCSVDMSGQCTGKSDEKSSFRLFPLSTLAVLRVDVLAQRFHVPLVFSGKVGLDTIFYRSRSGSRTDARSRSLGLHWGAQIAIQLDFLSPSNAHALDSDYGINHSYIFGEVFGSRAASRLPVGDELAWVAGLGLTL
ncbi:MAG: hypothetical protein KC543_04015 [Myxococcales bacterium]|nr:hypothetical protein [Myxococcales bacterium]